MKKKIVSVIIIVVLICLSAFGGYFYSNQKTEPTVVEPKPNNEPIINVEYIRKKIDNIASLETAQITYGCTVHFQQGSIKFITKKAFTMFYEVTAKAGINMEDITVSQKDGKVLIQLPPATITSLEIDPQSLEFYDKEKGLLTGYQPEDTKEALEYAYYDAKHQATTDQLMALADDNAVKVITNLISTFITDENQYEVISAKSNTKRIKPPYDLEKALTKDYKELEKDFKDAGFSKVKVYPVPDVDLFNLSSDGKTASVSIEGSKTFKSNNLFDDSSEVVIKYHTKK